ncbi:MAG: YwiC-like family protein [Anaerolineae bacterium]|nr:YwiC-like family protein [Anaerolineae bacterium]
MVKSEAKGRFRKQLLLPAEHGSWSWLLVPYLVGTAVAGTFNLATLLVLVGGLALFLLRQPATVWLRIRQGRGRQSDAPIVRRLVFGLSGVALLCLLGLLALGVTAIVWLALPVAGLLAVYVAAALGRQTSVRVLWMELAGAAGLALTAPAAMIAATGQITAVAWWLWLLLALLNVLGVLYVRLRLADTHGREADRRSMLLVHLACVGMVTAVAFTGHIPYFTILPFVALAGRALWAYPRIRPIPNIKKFGFTEVGVELACGLLLILAY